MENIKRTNKKHNNVTTTYTNYYNNICNTVRRSGRRRREPANIQNKTLIIQINKHKSKAAAPHGRLPHTKHKLKSRPGPLSSCTVVTPPFILPELLCGTRDRWVVQVSLIIINSTGLAPFPRLSAPPHSSQYINNIKISLVWTEIAISAIKIRFLIPFFLSDL